MAHRDPSRLKRARLIDRLAAGAIAAGGSLILLAVAFLMIFLGRECLPLLELGRAKAGHEMSAPPRALAAFEDEYRENILVVAEDGALHVVPHAGGAPRALPLEGATAPLRSVAVGPAGRLIAVLDAGGAVRVFSFRMDIDWQGQQRVLVPVLKPRAAAEGSGATALFAVAGESDDPLALAATATGAALVHDGQVVALPSPGPARAGALASDGSQAWLASGRELLWFDLTAPGEPKPGAEAPLPAAATVATVLLGDVTCLVGDAAGAVTAWQAVTGPVAGSRLLDLAATFAGKGPVERIDASGRDKSFLVARASGGEIVNLTSRRVVATLPAFPADVIDARLSPRRDGALALAGRGVLHRWSLDLKHPEVSLATLFLPVRYEGFTEPEFVWQSTGGSSAFESKLSLVPLIVGTFKGALFALVFSAPLALAAALFVSQFAPPRLRLVSKPVVELMAALPSVVVGFLAALLLAPLVQDHLLGVLGAVAVLPLAVVAAAGGWSLIPRARRRRLGPAVEFAAVTAAIAAALALAFTLDQPVERALFGGDFIHWLLDHAGIAYDQRNALVVGFGLGFAVIPIIFTLAEDAFANVPPSLVSASLALGASRWQAARTVVVPAASPGLFAAVMTGLGRAVGETMIVLMATGNTPILSLSPFNGMRTMSACIAVELPEAPYGDTLYRVLILTALLLFAMTFVINTVAVMISERLRRRFGRLAA